MLKKKILLILFIVLMVSSLSGCGLVSQDFYDNRSGGFVLENSTDLSKIGVSKGINILIAPTQGMYKDVYGLPNNVTSDAYKALAGFNNYSKSSLNAMTIITNLSTNMTDILSVDSVNNVAKDLVSGIKGLAIGVMFCIWFLNLVNTMSELGKTLEGFIKSLLQLLLGVILVENAVTMTSAFMEVVGSLGAENIGWEFGENSIGGFYIGSSVSIFGFTIAGWGFGFWFAPQVLLGLVGLLFPWLINLYFIYKIIECLVIRVLELAVRLMMAPIPIALTIHHGLGHEMASYIKSILGCTLIPITLLVALAGGNLVNDVVKTVIPGSVSFLLMIVRTVICQLILINFIGGANSLTKEIVGR